MLEFLKKICGTLARKIFFHTNIFTEEIICRPIVNKIPDQEFSWRYESVLFLSTEKELLKLSQNISANGATVAFRYLTAVKDIYNIPLEHYTMVIMPPKWAKLDFDAADIGKILRRTNEQFILVVASENFFISRLACNESQTSYDINLSLPATSDRLAFFCGQVRDERYKP